MKVILSALLTLSISTHIYAGACERYVAHASGAAALMTSGYSAFKWLSARDLEKKFTEVIAAARIPYGVLSNLRVQDGDRITVSYRLSTNAGRDAYIEALEMESQALSQQLNYESQTYFRQISSTDPDLQRLMRVNAELTHVNKNINSIAPTGRVFTRRFTRLEKADQFFAHLHGDQAWVTKIERIPALRLQQIRSVVRSGAVLGGLALTLGLITAEEVASCRLQRSRDGEYSRDGGTGH